MVFSLGKSPVLDDLPPFLMEKVKEAHFNLLKTETTTRFFESAIGFLHESDDPNALPNFFQNFKNKCPDEKAVAELFQNGGSAVTFLRTLYKPTNSEMMKNTFGFAQERFDLNF